MAGSLHNRRSGLEAVRARFGGASATDTEVDAPEIDVDVHVRSSWARCRDRVAVAAVTEHRADDAEHRWATSPIRHAEDLIGELGDVASSEDYVAAVTDADGAIVWTSGSRSMQRLADKANFVPGADWSEARAGTNAPALALHDDRAVSVFAGEHWCAPVHDWVCYAAPVHDAGGRVVGSIDLSSTWERASDMAAATVRSMARLVDQHLARVHATTSVGCLEIELLGTPRVSLDGRAVPVTLRQLEILTALALHGPSSLGTLHAHVYGDAPVSTATLKAEISHLRKALGGVIGSRPYSIDVPVRVDVLDVRSSVRSGRYGRALDLYRGPLLPDSESPLVTDERHHLDVVVRSSLLRSASAGDLVRFAAVHPYDAEVLEAAERRLVPGETCEAELAAALARLRR